MSGKNGYTAKQFIEQIPGTGGIIATIARRVGCDWNTAKKYITTMPTVKQVYDDECETVIDMAESTVIQSIRDKDVSTAKWYLKHKAKDRGYVERQEQVLSGEIETVTRIVENRASNPDD